MQLTTQQTDIALLLQDFDIEMEKLLKDWNAPGFGVGIVEQDKLVFAQGYGYRDYEEKLPFTSKTLFPIASNTKLFTAIAAGMLVEEGKLTWDKPIRDAVPTIRFYNNELNNTVTLRDMLAHRTGITRHDSMWYKQDSLTRKDVFDRIQYMKPEVSLREAYIYNNNMYTAVGYIIELLSGKTWEEFVCKRIFQPLSMHSTIYSIAEMLKQSDYGVPFTEKRESNEIYKIPYYEETDAIAPCGAIISNIEEMSHWLAALMNDGTYIGKQVIPENILKATIEPGMVLPNVLGETRGWWELLNPVYGMGRKTASYRGHLLTYHGGAIDGFHSQMSFLPQNKLGVIVFTIGDHCSLLTDIITYNVYERLLGLTQTPWSDRWLNVRLKAKQADKEARSKAATDRVSNTTPSHSLADYVGEYAHPVYGILKIEIKNSELQFNLGRIQLPLTHFHYDRFDTPDDELYGKESVNFLTNPQGDVNKVVMSIDEAEATFTRQAEILDSQLLTQLAGTYKTPTEGKLQVVLKDDNFLYLVFPGETESKLIPYKNLTFQNEKFSDNMFEFVMDNGQVKALKSREPSGEYVYLRILY
ncbi:penicillin-binding protein [Brasilonema octagenarum UFV-E1]|uniref:Penicillin-binding protein n=1 Tax=Brasilonema sennae CENA114 TaxID=415709 RepID=A0A856MNB3_9CYAN|nr:serine hydrolase [Brasilonema sennae]QDL11899.1 penicillin-binding protein [Brasilonema sennae CENA114]QDL18273.1 penicillin-binding protein [Brasilonema octagenarum UFV-E1]